MSEVSWAVNETLPEAATVARPAMCASVVLWIWLTPTPPLTATVPEPEMPMLAASIFAFSVAVAVTEAACAWEPPST